MMVDKISEEKNSAKNDIPIQYKGLEKISLSMKDELKVKEIVEEYAEKLQWQVNNQCDIEVHIKEFEKTGERHRYEAHCKFTFPGDTVSSKGEEWDVIAAVRDALESVKQQLESKFRDRPGKNKTSTAEFMEDYAR
ncbi:MAG: HPF/RaiA family ribosome-associated protein [Candidatus Woesearchaeota archaeon]